MTRICRIINALIIITLAVGGLLWPGLAILRNMNDPALQTGAIPRIAWQLHRDLTPGYELWARERVASGKAGTLNLIDVPSTEWPMFGSVFYLWATENLQAAWEKDHSLAPKAPAEYARGAIDACTDLIMDPTHHTWVRTHWGENYLHKENVFFRSLLIAGLTSYQRLTGNEKHRAFLLDQADSLLKALDASPAGLLNDYPGECYPIDVFAAIAFIQRADRVLGVDHSAMIEHSLRAFQGAMLDKCGLIPYEADPLTGTPLGPSRGIGNSYILIFARDLNPDLASKWYDLYEKHFWQSRWWAAGWREYPANIPDKEWFCDVDSGPVIAGFSPAGNAFGLAAAKVNGRLDHNFMLTAQVLTACWPLPNGRLLGPRILSDSAHAPYLGEVCNLFFLAQQTTPGVKIRTGGYLPGFVYLGLAFYFGAGLLLIGGALYGLRKSKQGAKLRTPVAWLQFALWSGLLIGAGVAFGMGLSQGWLILLLLAQFLPRECI